MPKPTAAHRRWWLERYTPDEIWQLAAAIWPISEAPSTEGLVPAGSESEVHGTSPGHASTQGGGDNMMLDGVPLDARAVHRLATILDGPLRRKIEQALFFSAEVVALTFGERVAILAALDRASFEFDELRELLLAGRSWDLARAGVS